MNWASRNQEWRCKMQDARCKIILDIFLTKVSLLARYREPHDLCTVDTDDNGSCLFISFLLTPYRVPSTNT